MKNATETRRCLLGLSGFIYTLPLTALYLLESAVLRGIMLSHAGSLISPFDIIRSLKHDAILALGTCLFFSILISLSGGPIRKILVFIFNCLMVFSFIALLAHTALFMYFGTGLAWSFIEHWLQYFSEASKIIIHEVSGAGMALLVLQAGLILAFLLVPRSRKARRLVSEKNCSYRKQVTVFMLAGVIFLEIYSFLPDIKDVHPAISSNAIRALLDKSANNDKKASSDAPIPEEYRIDGPLQLEKDPTVPPMNVVLLIFESLNWKNSDIFSPALGATPFLYALSEKGVTVEHIYTVVPHTTKALVSLLGGIYPFLDQEVIESIPGVIPPRCLAHLLRDQGYRTAFFQTANNYENRPQVVEALGFETFKGVFDMPDEGFSVTNYFGKEEKMMLQPSLDWVDSDPGRPFFLTYLTLCTHHDYNLPPSYPMKDYGVRDDLHNKYLNAVRYTDGFVKDIYSALEQRNLLENTLFIVVGDHGEAFAEHAKIRGHNTTLYEEGLRTLAILYSPNHLPPRTIIRGYRSILDIVPTVCDFLGLRTVNGRFIGESLLNPVSEDRQLFYSAWSKGYGLAMRQGPRKTIYWRTHNKLELFNNDVDPYDMDELTKSDSQLVSRAEEMKRKMILWSDSIHAQYRSRESAHADRKTFSARLSFENIIQANFNDEISLSGYEMYPLERPQGSSLWIKAGFRFQAKLKRPIEFICRIVHRNGASATQVLMGSETISSRNIRVGDEFPIEGFIRIPMDFPLGETEVHIGFRDKRTQKPLAIKAAGDPASVVDDMIKLGDIRILTGL